MPTAARSARSFSAGGAAPPARRWPAISSSPASKGVRPLRQRSSVDFPEPEGPSTATMAPAGASACTSSSTRAAPKLLRKPRMRIMGEAPFEAQRETRQREAHEEIEGGASEPRHDPIAQVDGGDG